MEVMILIFITAAGLWLGPIIYPVGPVYAPEVNSMPLFTVLLNIIGNKPVASALFSFGLVILVSVLLVNFNTAVFFISERTFLPAAIYLIFTGILPDCQTLNAIIPASVFLLIAIMRIMDAYRKGVIAYDFFDASLLLSIGSLFYAGLIWMGLLVFIGIILLRTISFKEVSISIIGLLTPYVILYGVYFVFGNNLRDLNSLIFTNLFGEVGTITLSKLTIVTLILTGLTLLTSMFHLFSVINAKKIKSRKTFSLLLWVLVLAVVSFIVLPSASDEIIFFIAIPMSYIVSHYYVFMRRKLIPEIFFTLILILTICIQIWYYK